MEIPYTPAQLFCLIGKQAFEINILKETVIRLQKEITELKKRENNGKDCVCENCTDGRGSGGD